MYVFIKKEREIKAPAAFLGRANVWGEHKQIDVVPVPMIEVTNCRLSNIVDRSEVYGQYWSMPFVITPLPHVEGLPKAFRKAQILKNTTHEMKQQNAPLLITSFHLTHHTGRAQSFPRFASQLTSVLSEAHRPRASGGSTEHTKRSQRVNPSQNPHLNPNAKRISF